MKNNKRPYINIELESFVKLIGNVTAAHEYLDCCESQLYKMRVGDRDMQQKYAKLITRKYPNLSFERLFIEKTKTSLTAV